MAVWLAAGLVVIMVGAVAVLALVYPSVAATYCPRCYGLVPLRDGLYAERGLPAARQEQIVAMIADANQRVDDFYGGRRSSPRVLACASASCYRHIGGGGERGIAVLNRAVMLSPRGLDTVIAAHELSHVELNQRISSHAAQVPQWFDEGLAVLVADDARYLLPKTAGDRCRIASDGASEGTSEGTSDGASDGTSDGTPDGASDGALPVTLDGWLRAASADEQVYARAACRVSRWVSAGGGPRTVLDLIDGLNRGDGFASVFRDP